MTYPEFQQPYIRRVHAIQEEIDEIQRRGTAIIQEAFTCTSMGDMDGTQDCIRRYEALNEEIKAAHNRINRIMDECLEDWRYEQRESGESMQDCVVW